MRFHLLVLSLVGVTLGLSAAQVRTHITTGGTLPTNCTVGDVWYKTGASAGFYACSATDTWTGVSSGGTALSGITAATGSNTIASGNNHSQIWNWALTSDSVSAMTFGETTAAANGGNDTQAIVTIATLATSTAIPLYVKCYGSTTPNCFRVDDASGDTSPFLIGSTGNVSIQTTTNTLPLNIGNVAIETSPAAIGTRDANPFCLESNASNHVCLESAGGTVLTRSAPASITKANSYLRIGGTEFGTNDYWVISFGYSGGTDIPAYVGYQEINDSGDTYGDLIFGTRNATSGAPTERLRIVNDGTVNIADLTNTGAATGKKVVCVDTATGKLYASSTGTDCSN